MKLINYFAVSIVLTISAGLAAAETTPPVDRVVVFADRAEVTRISKASCSAGKAEVVFSMLPMSLDERTLRAEASGKAKSIGVSSQVIPLEQDRDARVAKVSKEIEKLLDQIRAIQDTLQGYQERINVLSSFGYYFSNLLNEEIRNAKPDTARWSKVLDQMKNERLAVNKKRAEFNLKLRGLNRLYRRLERRLANLRPRSVTEARTVKVTIECRGEANPKVELSYVVPGATWHPEYDLRFIPGSKAKVGRGRAELTVAAVIQQSTGEDWLNAKLILSTSRPKLGSEAPYPAPLYINGHKVGEKKVLVATREKRDKLRGPAQQVSSGPTSAALEDKGQSFALTLPRRVSVMADGRPYWMPVDVVSTKAEAKLVAIAKLKPFVYQVVKFKNPTAYPLMKGTMHSHRGGSYIGDTVLEHTAPGEPMEISLGIDEELKVERVDLNKKNVSAGFLSSTKHLERAYRIKLTNRSSGRQAVELRENIPVSKIEDVKVELQKDKTTKHYQLDSHRGFISWTVRLNKGQKKAVDLAYTIHLPEDWEVRMR
jgi:uncharacterized protein (TIGR02231 family)